MQIQTRIRKTACFFFLSVFLLFSPALFAAAPVVNGMTDQNSEVIVTDQADGDASGARNTPPPAPVASANLPIKQRVTILEQQVSNLTGILTQMNQLQSQIEDLRGEVEVQKHALAVLQDQVRSQYQDIDQRLSAQNKEANNKTVAKTTKTASDDNNGDATKPKATKAVNKAPAAATDTKTAVDDKATAAQTAVKETDQTKYADKKAYQAAVDLLKDKKYTQATTAFQKFIKQYPASAQINNARFWLGQLYLLQGQPDRALEQFHVVLKKDPANKKTPDILLQMGLAYYAKGDLTRAQTTFKKIVQKYPTSSAAKLAQTRLKLLEQTNADQMAVGSGD